MSCVEKMLSVFCEKYWRLLSNISITILIMEIMCFQANYGYMKSDFLKGNNFDNYSIFDVYLSGNHFRNPRSVHSKSGHLNMLDDISKPPDRQRMYKDYIDELTTASVEERTSDTWNTFWNQHSINVGSSQKQVKHTDTYINNDVTITADDESNTSYKELDTTTSDLDLDVHARTNSDVIDDYEDNTYRSANDKLEATTQLSDYVIADVRMRTTEDPYHNKASESYTIPRTNVRKHNEKNLNNIKDSIHGTRHTSTNTYETRTHITNDKDNSSKIAIYIGALFELSGSRGQWLGQSELTAAKLAVDHVNKEEVIEGYELHLLYNDTGCDPGVGMDALYDLIYRGEQMLMVIGSACSEVTKTIAEIVPYWNLILVSFASTSPALSEREKYQTFFRLAPADSSQNVPRTMFIRHFGWNTVATLYESTDDYSLAIDEMGNTFEENNITISVSISFRQNEDIADKLKALKKHDARIIIGVFSENAARQVLCETYKLNMFGPRYVWIMIEDYVEQWWKLSNDTDCSIKQLDDAAEGYFTIDSLNSISDDDMSTANISLRDFLDGYTRHNGTRPLSPYATSTYDTVWTIALTLKKAQELWRDEQNETNRHSLESFKYNGGKAIANTFFHIMQRLGFLGISGPISFEGSDRKGISVINQNQAGFMKRIALYEPDGEKLNFYCRTCEPIIWIGGRAPRDKYVLVARQKKILPLAFLCVSSVSVVGLLLAVAFLSYNLYHRKLRYIKLSSPKLNNVAVIGCMLVYAGIIILGYDDSNLDERYYPGVCTSRAFLFAAGFSLAFGAMFTKTYRVHQIFTRANRGLIKSKLLRDKQLLFIIGALLIVDSAVLILWAFVDPMHKQITNLTMEASENDEDLLFLSQLTTCHSYHMEKWTGALYAYKGLLLIFGVYMAWETRNVKIPALNDSQYIGMNVYNVVIMSLTVVLLSNILSHRPTLAYVMESSFMLVSTTVTLCLLFIPKIYAIVKTKGNPVIAASGITVDSNCRRFVVDERQDLFYRAKVQNRVYKRETVQLDEEISRLECLLELPMQPYPRLTKELLHLLPESRVDPSPTLRRRRLLQERDMCNSITDAGDMCMGDSEDKSDDDKAINAYGVRYSTQYMSQSPRNIRRRANRLSIRVTNYAVSKLSKLRPRFSIGSVNFKHEYEDLKGSPSPDGQPSGEDVLARGRLSHPLLRQEAVEERREMRLLSSMHHSSEKSETRTFETQISDNGFDDLQPDIEKSRSMSDFSASKLQTEEYVYKTADTLRIPSNESNVSGCEQTETSPFLPRRPRRFGNTLEVPSQECKISSVDIPSPEDESPKIRRARSIIEHERRTRIRKLQNDLLKMQKELQDLNELEYDVSLV